MAIRMWDVDNHAIAAGQMSRPPAVIGEYNVVALHEGPSGPRTHANHNTSGGRGHHSREVTSRASWERFINANLTGGPTMDNLARCIVFSWHWVALQQFARAVPEPTEVPNRSAAIAFHVNQVRGIFNAGDLAFFERRVECCDKTVIGPQVRRAVRVDPASFLASSGVGRNEENRRHT